MKNLFDLTGKVAIVIGGSRGLGKGMAKGMGRHGIVGSFHPRIAGKDITDSSGGKRPTMIIQEQGPNRLTGSIVAKTKQLLLPLGKILLQGSGCSGSKEHSAVLSTLAPHHGGTEVLGKIFQGKASHLRNTTARGIKHLEQSLVSGFPQQGVFFWCGTKLLYLRGCHKLW